LILPENENLFISISLNNKFLDKTRFKRYKQIWWDFEKEERLRAKNRCVEQGDEWKKHRNTLHSRPTTNPANECVCEEELLDRT
jgi:hypothetical protein